ncbi:hypothetical protein GJ744_007187 [Endocarpon pusillum]|uniref:Uncharacterized protein n=1 Tax=Endocarpon pusillum TaxID=364733 RepID=A0A8H7AJ69_9EURO|nr:hypothetical protein GJ744_007187 [Endocarpon pusillum]
MQPPIQIRNTCPSTPSHSTTPIQTALPIPPKAVCVFEILGLIAPDTGARHTSHAVLHQNVTRN